MKNTKSTYFTILGTCFLFCSFVQDTTTTYTEVGTNVSWDLLKNTLLASTTSVTGSTIDVANFEYETCSCIPEINPAIKLHTLSDTSIENITNWKRWFQTDGNTQVFRLFTGEYSIVDSRGEHPRIEAYSNAANNYTYDSTKWHVFKAKYSPIYIANSACIFQAKNTVDDWALMIVCTSNGNIKYTKRNGTELTLENGMMGKSFDIMVKDDGKNYKLYYNGVVRDSGSYTRNTGYNQFRWGFYLSETMTGNNMMFVTGATFGVENK